MKKIICEGCKYHIFDYVWGEHKCKFRSRKIYDPEKMEKCKHFEKETEGKKDDGKR